MLKPIALAVGLGLSAVVGASAETPEEQQACTDDALRLCQDAIPDRERVFACLVTNKNTISQQCRAVLAKYTNLDPPTKGKRGSAAASPAPARNGGAPGAPMSIKPR